MLTRHHICKARSENLVERYRSSHDLDHDGTCASELVSVCLVVLLQLYYVVHGYAAAARVSVVCVCGMWAVAAALVWGVGRLRVSCNVHVLFRVLGSARGECWTGTLTV